MDKNRLKFRVWITPWGNSESYMQNIQPLQLHVYFGNWERGGYKEAIFQQYTGLQDSEGKYIYEGDILEIPRNYYVNGKQQFIYGEVHFYDYKFAVRSNKEKDYYPIVSLTETSIVVGNIFENKDLLK